MKSKQKSRKYCFLISIALFLMVIVIIFCNSYGEIRNAGYKLSEVSVDEEKPLIDQAETFSCSKPMSLYPEDCNDVKKYNHSEVITKRLEIHAIQCDKIELNVDIPEHVTMFTELPVDVSGLDHIDIAFKLNDEFTDGKIEFFTHSEEGDGHACLYLLHEDKYDYTSFLSMESFMPYSERIKNYFEEEWHKGESSFIEEKDKGDNSQKGPAVYEVSGYIRWTDVNRYLSAGASSNGANVYWAPESSSIYQVWSLTEL